MTYEVCFWELMGNSTYQNDTVGDAMGAGVEKQAQKRKLLAPIVIWVLLPNVLSVSLENEFT